MARQDPGETTAAAIPLRAMFPAGRALRSQAIFFAILGLISIALATRADNAGIAVLLAVVGAALAWAVLAPTRKRLANLSSARVVFLVTTCRDGINEAKRRLLRPDRAMAFVVTVCVVGSGLVIPYSAAAWAGYCGAVAIAVGRLAMPISRYERTTGRRVLMAKKDVAVALSEDERTAVYDTLAGERDWPDTIPPADRAVIASDAAIELRHS